MLLGNGLMVQQVGMPQMPNFPKCYVEECYTPASLKCQALICCGNYGCGKMMCQEHTSNKCIAHSRGGP